MPPPASPAAAPARAVRYCDSLQAPLETAVGPEPRAPVHRVEWRKVSRAAGRVVWVGLACSLLRHVRLYLPSQPPSYRIQPSQAG